MAVGDGKFALYSSIQPPLVAGDYVMAANQILAGNGELGALDRGDLPVAELATTVRVRAPRFALPPDQVLSTFPPANSEGSYGMRLPQIVIKRRTLPWERSVTADTAVPWLALVVVAEGEAELKLNQPVADCVTPGRVLPGVADVELGAYLSVAKSMVDDLFPTQDDVRLLAHAREVDITDTELMMGDDDGFLAVVVANRLPLAGRDADGSELPVKYLACLVSLEGQYDLLPPEPPEPLDVTYHPIVASTVFRSASASDKVVMQTVPQDVAFTEAPVLVDEVDIDDTFGATTAGQDYTLATERVTMPGADSQTALVAHTVNAEWTAATTQAPVGADVYVEMARDFATTKYHGIFTPLDPMYRFPVLLHWSFTSIGDRTFQKLMEDLDSGLLGTLPSPDADADADELEPVGREPLELVETGHVGLVHQTRRGDTVRTWYRGPLLPHPSVDPDDDRLALAHAADQLRIVVPDGREDLSLSGAFEIGRLLALARPSIVASLMRWRQIAYSTARSTALWNELAGTVFDGLLTDVAVDDVERVLVGSVLGALVTEPDQFLGPPSRTVTPGAPIDTIGGETVDAIARGLAIPRRALTGTQATMLGRLTGIDVTTKAPTARGLDERLTAQLDEALLRLVTDTLGDKVLVRTPRRPGVAGDHYRGGPRFDRALRVTDNPDVTRRRRDALDRLLRRTDTNRGGA